jgi:NitT/TauT family transport system substrate-binding protein
MPRLHSVILIIVLLAIASSGCNLASQPKGEITLAMGYIPNVQFAPYYVALDKGYYTAEGLKVTFNFGAVTDLLKLVGTNQIQFALASGDEVITARSNGLPLVYVLTQYQRYPVVVFSLAEKGITQPANLQGKKVGLPLYGASLVGLKAILYASKVKESDLTLMDIGYTQAAAVSEGKVDAAVGYAVNEPIQLRAAGKAVNVLYVADYINLVSAGMVTNEETIAKQPQLVRALVRGILKGMQDTMANPEEAMDITIKYVPEAGGANRATQLLVLQEAIKLWQPDPARGQRLGYADLAAWQESQAFLLAVGLIPKETPVEKMVTNQFLP